MDGTVLEEGFFLRAAVPGEVPEEFDRWPADERDAEKRDGVVPDDEDQHQREHDCNELREGTLPAHELGERVRIWKARNHQDRDDDSEERYKALHPDVVELEVFVGDDGILVAER